MSKILIPILILALSACATDYPCGEPSSGSCRSVSANDRLSYTNYTNPDDLDNSTSGWGGSKSNSQTNSLPVSFKHYNQIPSDGSPLLSMPKMLRVWITPYTDTDNIYHDQGYEYMIVDKGRWNYSNNKILNSIGGVKDVTAAQVTDAKIGGYGSYGLADQPPKSTNPIIPVTPFPAINALQNQQAPIITSTTVGSGIDRTTTITP